MPIRIPIRYITVFGVTALVAVAAGIVFYLGFVSATKNTRLLMSDQANVMINSLERNIALWLRPVHEQSKWIAEHVANNSNDIIDIEQFDQFMLGALAATDQVAGVALLTPDGLTRRWARLDALALLKTGQHARESLNGLQAVGSVLARPGSNRFSPIQLIKQSCSMNHRFMMPMENYLACWPRLFRSKKFRVTSPNWHHEMA